MVQNKRDAILRLYSRRLTRPSIANLLGVEVGEVEDIVDGEDRETSGREFQIKTEEDFAVWAIVGPETDEEEAQLAAMRDRMLYEIRQTWTVSERSVRGAGSRRERPVPETEDPRQWERKGKVLA